MKNESFTIVPPNQTYKLSVSDLQKLFARDLGVPEDRVSLDITETGITVVVASN